MHEEAGTEGRRTRLVGGRDGSATVCAAGWNAPGPVSMLLMVLLTMAACFSTTNSWPSALISCDGAKQWQSGAGASACRGNQPRWPFGRSLGVHSGKLRLHARLVELTQNIIY